MVKDIKLEKKEITKQALTGIVYRTIALIAFIAVIAYLFSGRVTGFDVSFLFMPLLVGAILLYVALLPGLLLGGEMARPLSVGLISLAVTVLLSLIASSGGPIPELKAVSTPLLIFGFMVTIHFLSRAYSDMTGILSRAGVIATGGFLIQAFFTIFHNDVISQCGFIIMVGSVSLAVASLLGLFRGHNNSYLAYIGKALSEIKNLLAVFVAASLIMFYFVFLRPLIIAYASGWLIAVEWLIMCAVIILLFLRARSYTESVSELQKFGDGHAVACQICFNKEDMESASAIVKDFVDNGKKEGLIALVASTLVTNGAPVEDVWKPLAVIVNYADDPAPMLMFRWTVGDVSEANRKKRLQAVSDMIDAAAVAINVKTPAQEA